MVKTEDKKSRAIYIFDDIEDSTVKDALISFSKFMSESNEPVHVYINSRGGVGTSCCALIDMIVASPCKVITYVLGYADSAAAIIAIAGHERNITKHSHMMFHRVKWGRYSAYQEEMSSQVDFWKKWESNIDNFVAKRFNITPKKYRELISNELWLTADEAIKMKIMDKIWLAS